MCFEDKTRPCTATCTAYNRTPLDGTHCIKLAGEWGKAKGSQMLASSLDKLNTTITVVLASLGKR